MPFDLSIRNYRCFQEPINLSIGANLTALIGINNSGKSSILRFFVEFRDIFAQLEKALVENRLSDLLDPTLNKSFIYARTLSDYEEMFCDMNRQNIEFTITWGDHSVDLQRSHEFSITVTALRSTPDWEAELRISGTEYKRNVFGNVVLSGDVIRWGNQIATPKSITYSIFHSLVNTQYIGSYRNILNANPPASIDKKNYFDLEIGGSFVERWRRLKSGPKRSEYRLAAKVTEDIRRILNYQHLEINASNENETLQIIIDGNSYRLPELGSGIAQFIIVFANAALKNPSYILIDEPELNLHPSLQADFLSSLAAYANEGVIYATHNAGLAIGYADRIYSVRKTQSTSNVTLYEQTPRLSEFLGELGYAAYRDLGFDKILLVEGPSEVKVIGQWLRLYDLSHKVVVLHLGGSSSINGRSEAELLEIKRISQNVYALIDSERTAAGATLASDRDAFRKTCQRTGIECFITERRATENYFTDRAVKKALGERFSGLKEFDQLNELVPKWKKSDNWRIAAEMTKDEIRNTDLHELFIALS